MNGSMNLQEFATLSEAEQERLKILKQKFVKDTYRIGCEVLEGGRVPHKTHSSDAGFDVFATEDIVIKRGEMIKHPLNIKLEIPKGAYLHLHVKSGLGSKGMAITSCVIDESYRGIPHVVATCLVDEPIVIKKGQKLAQLVPYPFSTSFYFEEVDSVSEDTERGGGGFGSTGA